MTPPRSIDRLDCRHDRRDCDNSSFVAVEISACKQMSRKSSARVPSLCFVEGCDGGSVCCRALPVAFLGRKASKKTNPSVLRGAELAAQPLTSSADPAGSMSCHTACIRCLHTAIRNKLVVQKYTARFYVRACCWLCLRTGLRLAGDAVTLCCTVFRVWFGQLH